MHSRLEWILTRLHLKEEFLPAFIREGIDDTLLVGLTDEDLRSIGIEKLGDRKRLLKEFARLTSSEFAAQPRIVKSMEPHAKVPSNVQPKHQSQTFSDEPMLATTTKPFINSLGVPFVPISRGKTLCSVWQLRIQDYARYCSETGAAMPSVDFPQGMDHPVVNVRWNDSHVFCEWLTKREIWLGLIPPRFAYRLPHDEEWSTAIGLTYESGRTPKDRSGVVEGYPWGDFFPPPHGAGNYHPRLQCDEYPETSPVGSFAPNKFGICDLGGNVWEWCLDLYEKGSPHRVLRGASCFNDDPLFLMSSFRDHCLPDYSRNNVGIRLVLAPAIEGEPWNKS